MNLKFSEIGSYCIATQYLEAEQLAEKLAPKEVESKLWICQVLGQEVEIMLHNQHTVKNLSCDCDEPKAKLQFCKHQLATLIQLGAIFEERRVQQKIAENSKNTNILQPVERFTINSVLEQVTHQDLISFIKEFGKNNRTFSMSLKSHFAHKINLGFDDKKYQILFDNILKTYQNTGKKLTRQGVQQFFKLWNQLTQQAENEYVKGSFLQQWAIYKELFEVSYLVLRFLETDDLSKNDHAIHALVENTKRIFKTQSAPALKNEIWQFLLLEISKRRYWRNGISFLIIDTLLKNADANNLNLLEEKIDTELKEADDNNRKKLIFNYLALEYKLGNKEKYQKIITKYEFSGDEFLQFATNFFETNLLFSAENLAKLSLEQVKEPTTVKNINDLLLSIYVADGNFENVTILANKLILIYQEEKYFDLIKQSNTRSKTWQKDVQQLLAALQKSKKASQYLLSHIYCVENLYPELVEFIQKQDDFELYLRYDYLLLKDRLVKNDFEKNYQNFVVTYLQNHFGSPAAAKLSKTIAHLYEIKCDFFAKKLLELIRKEFKDRNIFLEEIAEL